MKLTPPKNMTFWISILLGLLGFLGKVGVRVLAPFDFWLVFIAYVLLVVALVVKGL
jgi:hypothetical protein